MKHLRNKTELHTVLHTVLGLHDQALVGSVLGLLWGEEVGVGKGIFKV